MIWRKNAQTSSEPAVWDKGVKVSIVKAIQGLLVCYRSFGVFRLEAFAVASNSTRGF